MKNRALDQISPGIALPAVLAYRAFTGGTTQDPRRQSAPLFNVEPAYRESATYP